MHNATTTTPEGAFAYVSPQAYMKGKLGYWSKVGDGAIVPPDVELGPWTAIGHFAKIGRGVKFGPWASVGMDAIVDPGVELGSHEYVPSGHRRKRDGRSYPLPGFEEDREIHRLFGSCFASGGSRIMSHEEARWEDDMRRRDMDRLAGLLPAYLERRNKPRPARVGWLLRLLSSGSTSTQGDR